MHLLSFDKKGMMMKIKFLFVVVLVSFLLPGGCGPRSKGKESGPERNRGKWETEVRGIIKDPGRAEKVIDLGVQFEGKHRAIYEEIDRYNKELWRLNRDYGSTREDYEEVFRKFTEKKNEAVRQFLDGLYAMRQQTTPEEWKALQP
jgi:hypothetical protein